MARCCGGTPRPTPDNPVLIGEPNGVTVRARPTIPRYGLAAYETGWFTGDGVAARVAAGVLVTVA